MLTNNWFLIMHTSKFERVLHCHYTLEWSRAMCLFPQIKCFCSDSYCNKVQYDCGWMGGYIAWRLTYSKDVNVIVVASPFSPTMPDGFGEQTNTVTLKQSLTAWNSTWVPQLNSHKCTCGLSTWHIYLWSSKAGQLFCCFQSLPARYM